jgi:lipopolysaccharide export system permease protein
MNVLTAYIVREILKGSLVAVLLLLTLYNLFTFADELRDLGRGSYALKDIFIYLSLTSPTVFFQLMPSAALLGSLFVLGAMANSRELVAMRVSGISVFGIIKAVMLAGLVLASISISVGEFIAPAAQLTAKTLRSEAQHAKVEMKSVYGLWLRDGNQFINIRQVVEEGVVADINIYELDEQRHVRAMSHVKQAQYAGAGKWVLQNVVQSEITAKQIFASKVKTKDWASAVEPDLLDIVVVKPDNLSLYDLAMYIQFLNKNNQKSESFELAFWGRVVNPLSTVVMLLVSAPFVMGFRRGGGVGSRMVIGVIFGMGFKIIDKISSHVGLVYDFNPLLIAFFPSTVVFAGAVYAISRLR